MAEMSDAQRALQFWSVLVFAAKEQKILSYGTLEKITGMVRQGAGRPLGYIAAYCMKNDLPLLNTLAVSQKGKPSPKFLEDIDAVSQQAVFVYDWISHKAPTTEELQAAYEWAQKNGKFQAAATAP
jgi:hypothetical protein